ncbi:type II toxin-antitoxin system VapC family toxin [Xanthomonas massiliensis]|uniref:type II toxin-antitoxin system VapC family toxin n=1 Tax=Xanthomonas massiliensis TaxID=1720302 RepID=UPI0008262DB5|nr:type II toxin-antitoxin system VapC family toxin [Xanthomonas massiliensis]
MRLLLDTHIALWAIADDARLSAEARQLICAPDNDIWVSVASVWEIAIKHSLGRGGMPVSAARALGYFEDAGYDLLPVRANHASAVEQLPPLHGDPFDRMLVAQALSEPLRLLTHDAAVARYDKNIVLV